MFSTITKLIVKKNQRMFQLYIFCSLLSNCYQAFLMATPLSSLVYYKLFCLVSVLSDAILTLLLSFVFQNGHEVFDVINFCCCCLILLFLLTRFLNICTSHQSNAPFLLHHSYLFWRLSFRSYTNFFKKYFNFWVFLCSSFGRQSSQNCG